MLLLLDIGNTHTHLGWADKRRVVRHQDVPTSQLLTGGAEELIRRFVGRREVTGAALCSVVPRATPAARALIDRLWSLPCLELTAKTATGIGIDYPLPQTIGPDRLANALAARRHFGAPSVWWISERP
jgi:type III pantothenate kinase